MLPRAPSESARVEQLEEIFGAQAFPTPEGWAPGTVVGLRYRLVAKIATGGMAEIWLAQQLGLKSFQKLVAIKKIAEHVAADPELTEMFFEEARLAAQLSHPNVVQVYDLGEHASAYYIAMEYLPGENLAQVVRAGRARRSTRCRSASRCGSSPTPPRGSPAPTPRPGWTGSRWASSTATSLPTTSW